MAADVPTLGAVIGYLWFFAMAVGFAVYLVAFPWLMFSGARSLRRQARQLERIAEALERHTAPARDEFRELELQRRARG